jgi:hypothetical protein
MQPYRMTYPSSKAIDGILIWGPQTEQDHALSGDTSAPHTVEDAHDLETVHTSLDSCAASYASNHTAEDAGGSEVIYTPSISRASSWSSTLNPSALPFFVPVSDIQYTDANFDQLDHAQEPTRVLEPQNNQLAPLVEPDVLSPALLI